MIVKFENAILEFARVRWLNQGRNRAVLESIGKAFDTVLDALVEAAKARFPSKGPNDSLDEHATERGLIQGDDESDEDFIVRLQEWIDTRATKGNPYALMRQLQAYFSGHSFVFRVVNARGAWYTLNADGSTDYHLSDPMAPRNWVWDDENDVWWKYWIIIYPPENYWTTDGVFGDPGDFGDPGGWGFSITAEQTAAIRKIIANWGVAHAQCEYAIVSFDPDKFDPEATTGLPDGTWGKWGGRGSSRVLTRDNDVRWIRGH